MHRFEDVITESDKVLDAYSNSRVWSVRGGAYLKLGRLDEALHSYRRLFENRPELLDALERGNTQDGPVGAIRAIADAVALKALQTKLGSFEVALWYARAGDGKESLAWLEQAYTQGLPELIYVSVRPELDFMHAMPEFRELIDRMGLSVD